ncbi:MAG: hypothetical protein JXB60_02655 [Candidatus Cloacimonetes bacterium]|nr:hypothetical protein [Candidatus Cloacimonadota bacterium]
MKISTISIIFLSTVVLMLAAPRIDEYSTCLPNVREFARADSAHGFDVIRYDITLTIDDQAHYVEGSVLADVLAEEDIAEIVYELQSLNVDAVYVNSIAADYTYQNGMITIQLGSVAAGEYFTTRVDYSGYPVLSNDDYHLGMIFSSNYVFTLADPSGCRWWWPAYDHPWDKAEVDFHITMRDDWLVACNGIRTAIVDNLDGTCTHHWDGSNPMATFLACVTAANFQELPEMWFDDVPVMNFVSAPYYDEALEDFSNLPFMIQVYSDHYGYYPFEKYGNTVVPMQTFGAMEHQTMTTMGTTFITGNHTHETTVAHELAHSWFGNCLTPLTWADVWLSEGFAVYSEAVYMQSWQGWEAMLEYVQQQIQGYYKSWAGGSAYTIYDPDFINYFTPVTYEKAASVLHVLRALVGNETFFTILQTYFSTFQNQNVITADFREICENVSGVDLEQFFQQWIFHPGLPAMEYCYFLDEDLGQGLIYVLTTANAANQFYLQVPVHINYSSATRDSLLVEATPDFPAETQFMLTGGEVTALEFDPDSWIISRQNTLHNPQIGQAYAADSRILIIWNEFWNAVTIDGFNLWRSDNPEGEYSRINEEIITGNYYLDEDVVNWNTYYYRITAVKGVTFETTFSDYCAATPIDLPMDQGLLVVDETMDGAGIPGNPDDNMVDQFYENIINTDFTSYDYSDQGAPTLDFLGCYSTIIWHDDDLTQHFILNNLDKIGSYLVAGGNLVLSGWKTAFQLPQDFAENFLDLENRSLVSEWQFTGAWSDLYPEINIDPDKVNPAFNGTLPFVTIFPGSEYGIYYFSAQDDSSSYQDEICGVRISDLGQTYLFGFPLYYTFQSEAEMMMDQILLETPQENNQIPPSSYCLLAYPNPCILSANKRAQNISFTFSMMGSESVDLIVYNIRGQKVRTLLADIVANPGINIVAWDLMDDYNRKCPSGVYLYGLHTNAKADIRKLVLIK